MIEIHLIKCRQKYVPTGKSAEFFFLVTDLKKFLVYRFNTPEFCIVGEVEFKDLSPETCDRVLVKLPGAVKYGFAVV